MFNIWAYSLFIAAGIAMLLSCKTPRAWFWIGVGGASFIASSLFWDFADRNLHPLFTMGCDMFVCLVFYKRSQIEVDGVPQMEQWELWLFLLYIVSVFISFLKLIGFVPTPLLYAQLLELVNWAALFCISGVGLTDIIARYEPVYVGRVRDRLHSARNSVQ